MSEDTTAPAVEEVDVEVKDEDFDADDFDDLDDEDEEDAE